MLLYVTWYVECPYLVQVAQFNGRAVVLQANETVEDARKVSALTEMTKLKLILRG